MRSAIKVTHTPTGIACIASTERSQHFNRRLALRVVKARVWQLSQGCTEPAPLVRTWNLEGDSVEDACGKRPLLRGCSEKLYSWFREDETLCDDGADAMQASMDQRLDAWRRANAEDAE